MVSGRAAAPRAQSLEPDVSAELVAQFDALAIGENLHRGTKKYKVRYTAHFGGQLEKLYQKAGKLAGLQELCLDVGIDPAPNSITKCRQALKGVNVNIYDLVQFKLFGGHLLQFDSKKLLAANAKKKGKIFPKELAKENGILSALLINMSRARYQQGS
ncbi:hypothetical protein EJ06DRAFT_556766 [Trichodelitschia bisporula]|uniref:Uncharacterized protein n=1 Tax=Trichodelitschia bisporula TaxID=703511 RepID=A0A6G1HWZ9_9PEZI|nr:hypothetical protein EJ06DRAFT_556766 [Trichodelitschia bisporula]